MKIIPLRHKATSLPPRWGLDSYNIYRGFAALHPRLNAAGPVGAWESFSGDWKHYGYNVRRNDSMMDKAKILTAIECFRKNLESHGIQSSTIILYGSFARGDWNEWSDIDLIVVSEDFRNLGYWERIDKMVEAIYPTRAPIEAVAMTPDEWEKGDSMIAQFAKDGELVFEAK